MQADSILSELCRENGKLNNMIIIIFFFNISVKNAIVSITFVHAL